MSPRTTLHIRGFSSRVRARDLAYEFERYGPIIRCDIPPVRNPAARPFAFVEFEDRYDAEDAYYEMHEKRIRSGDVIFVEWAKGTPVKRERIERGRYASRYDDNEGRNSRYRNGSRSRSPLRDDTKNRDRSRSVSRGRGRSRSRSVVSRSGSVSRSRSRSRSPSGSPVKHRSASPVARSHDGPKSRSRSPIEASERGSQSDEPQEPAKVPVVGVSSADRMEGIERGGSSSASMSVDKE